jgi:hypothetical protein
MMGKKKMAMKRGGSPVKKRGGGMLIKKRGGGAMGPKKKMAGGGMMGPKKKMAKGGVLEALKRLKRRTSPKIDGRSAAAKKIANKSISSKKKSKLMAGKGNPAGKDMSTMAIINRLLAKGPPKRKDMGPMPSRPPKRMKPLGRRKKG